MKLATVYFSPKFHGEKIQEVRNYDEMKTIGLFTVFVMKSPNQNPHTTHLFFKTKFIHEITVQYGDDL